MSVLYQHSDYLSQFADVLLADAAAAANHLNALIHPAFGCLGIVCGGDHVVEYRCRVILTKLTDVCIYSDCTMPVSV